MSGFIDGYEAFGRIRSLIRSKYGNQRNCARSLGLSEGHLSDMLNGRCEISPILLADAGLVRRTVYQIIAPKEEPPLPANTDSNPVDDAGVDMPSLIRKPGRSAQG